jgi:hypothetical protein
MKHHALLCTLKIKYFEGKKRSSVLLIFSTNIRAIGTVLNGINILSSWLLDDILYALIT